MVQKLFKFGGGEGESTKVDRRFLAFEDKTIDEQADDITRQLIFAEDNPMFEFDSDDQTAKREFQKSVVVAGITIHAVWFIDVKVLNTTQWGLALGPLRKFLVINAICTPIYWIFYT